MGPAPGGARLAIVYPRASLDTVPSLTNAAELLAERGYSVDVFTYVAASQPAPRFAHRQVRLRPLGVEGVADASTAGVRKVVRQAGWLRDSPLREPLRRGYVAVGAGLASGSRLLARARTLSTGARYRCVIGVDPEGLELAHRLARGAPVAYYSLELLLSNEVSDAERRIKDQERSLSRLAPFVVVQDADRGRLLAQDNDLPWQRLILVPNAPRGPARRRPSEAWRARFGLAPSQRVVLHAGSLGDWTGVDAIVDSVPSWPDDWVLVVHTRYDAGSSTYVDRLRARAAPGRVFFSLKPVPRQAYDDLIDGADVGLGFYVATGDSSYTRRNIQTIGLSSGKLAYYLRAGLPVVVNAAASVSRDVEAFGCGVAVDQARDIPAALAQLEQTYAAYSQRACAFFDQHLEFSRAFAAVIERIDWL